MDATRSAGIALEIVSFQTLFAVAVVAALVGRLAVFAIVRGGRGARAMTAEAKNRILLITAHPDDADVHAGGTVARWVDDGHEVHAVIATRGARLRRRGGDRRVP